MHAHTECTQSHHQILTKAAIGSSHTKGAHKVIIQNTYQSGSQKQAQQGAHKVIIQYSPKWQSEAGTHRVRTNSRHLFLLKTGSRWGTLMGRQLIKGPLPVRQPSLPQRTSSIAPNPKQRANILPVILISQQSTIYCSIVTYISVGPIWSYKDINADWPRPNNVYSFGFLYQTLKLFVKRQNDTAPPSYNEDNMRM